MSRIDDCFNTALKHILYVKLWRVALELPVSTFLPGRRGRRGATDRKNEDASCVNNGELGAEDTGDSEWLVSGDTSHGFALHHRVCTWNRFLLRERKSLEERAAYVTSRIQTPTAWSLCLVALNSAKPYDSTVV